jgi:hypothetical protein
MKGALRVMVLFFGAMGVQRVLLGAGALFVLVGIFVPQHVRIVLILLGLGIPLVPTLFAGGVLLRYFIAPIHMRLIPGARAQVLGGMLLSTLAVATVATLGLWGAGVDTDLLPILWLRIATAGSVVLLTQFVVATSVPGMTFWFVAIASLGPLTASAGTRDFLQLIGQNGSLLVAIFVISWITFALWFLRARTIRSPNEANPHGNRILKVSHSQASAVRAFLFGNPSIGGQFAGSFLMVAVLTVIWVFMALASGQALTFADALTRSINPTLMLALYAGIGGFLVVRRSKSLWLRGGRDRMGVFRTCEAQAWSHYFATVTSILVLVAIACLVAPASRWWYVVTLIFQMCGGVWLLYLGLMHVRGWRAFDIITTFVLFGAWILMFANLQFVIDRPWTLPILVVAMAAVALALRFIAAHRWRRIDWLVCKPPRPMPRMRPTALARD